MNLMYLTADSNRILCGMQLCGWLIACSHLQLKSLSESLLLDTVSPKQHRLKGFLCSTSILVHSVMSSVSLPALLSLDHFFRFRDVLEKAENIFLMCCCCLHRDLCRTRVSIAIAIEHLCSTSCQFRGGGGAFECFSCILTLCYMDIVF